MFFQEQTAYNSLDEHSVDDPEEYHPPLSPASGAESLFLAGLTASFSPDDLSKQLRKNQSASSYCSVVSLNTTATDDFMSAAGTVDDLLMMDCTTAGTNNTNHHFNSLPSRERFSIPELLDEGEEMNAFKKNTPTPTAMPPKEPLTTTTTESHADAAANVYEGAKGVWAWGKGVAVFSPFMGMAEAVAGKALQVAGTNMEELDSNIVPQLKNLDSGILNPAIEKVTEVMLGAAGKAEEIVKPIFVLIMSPFKMLEQQPSNETPEVTN